MFKKLKTKFRNYKLKKRLLKSKAFFNSNDLSFSEKNVLIIDQIIPEFNKDSGSRRLTQIIKLLLEQKIAVFLVADLKQYKYKSDYIEKFKTLGVNVYEPLIDEAGNLLTKERYIKKIAPKLNSAWLHRPDIFDKYYSVIKQTNPKIKLIFDMVDFHYIRLLREYEINKNVNLRKRAERYLEMELNNCRRADAVIAISKEDKKLLSEFYKDQDKKLVVISNIHQYQKKTSNFKSFHERENILFVGSFRHQPNQDAVLYLKNSIMPLVWSKNPNIKVTVIGSYVTPEIKALDSNNFKITGFVADLDPELNNVRVFVAPLRFGAGIKGKIGQSLEFGLPLVTTDIGAEGFDFNTQSDIMIANTKEDIANKILNLYQNETAWQTASDACEMILKPFSIEETKKKLFQLIND